MSLAAVISSGLVISIRNSWGNPIPARLPPLTKIFSSNWPAPAFFVTRLRTSRAFRWLAVLGSVFKGIDSEEDFPRDKTRTYGRRVSFSRSFFNVFSIAFLPRISSTSTPTDKFWFRSTRRKLPEGTYQFTEHDHRARRDDDGKQLKEPAE